MRRRPKPGDPACGGCGMPVWVDESRPARFCCQRAWALLGGKDKAASQATPSTPTKEETK